MIPTKKEAGCEIFIHNRLTEYYVDNLDSWIVQENIMCYIYIVWSQPLTDSVLTLVCLDLLDFSAALHSQQQLQ